MTNSSHSNIKLYIKYIIYIIIILLIGILIYNNIQLRNKITNDKYNISALTDSLQISKDKYNREIASKNILLADINKLEEMNSSLIIELDKTKKKNLTEINKLNFTINNLSDSIKFLNGNFVEQVNNKYIYEFKDSTEFRLFKNQVEIKSINKPDSVSLKIIEDKIFADLIINKYIEKNQIKLQVVSNNPNLKISNIEGAIIDVSDYKKVTPKKRFSLNIGPQIGVGYNLGTNFKQLYNGLGFYIGIGFGISYNLINF